jgi:hypothetical protein
MRIEKKKSFTNARRKNAINLGVINVIIASVARPMAIIIR